MVTPVKQGAVVAQASVNDGAREVGAGDGGDGREGAREARRGEGRHA